MAGRREDPPCPGFPGHRRGAWWLFDDATGLINEIRAYYAAPTAKMVSELLRVEGAHTDERVAIDYAGRGYHRRWE